MKKLFLLLSASAVLFSCSKVGKDEYIITGTAAGIENGKTIILQTQDPNGMGGLINIDTVKVENGKFEIKGKVTEPSIHFVQLEAANQPILFILESGEINIEVNKDSIQKSKISGTYNNDEYVKFNDEMKVIQKKLIDFQSANMLKMNQAQQAKDTAVINGLMKQYQTIQEEVGANSKTKFLSYAETHPKSFISALIIQSMLQDPSADIKQAEKIYNGFDEELKNTKPGKEIKQRFAAVNSSVPGAAAPGVAPAAAN
ncbi:MAG: thiol:disulfide interchange protein [Flavobacteriales bacterium 32-34-25]|nr:MAG: thiol:disulfide interchange protein [Flavobacteriales bacterium 32-34-25]